MRNIFQQNIPKTFDNGVRFLALVECVPKSGVDGYDIVYIPENLCKEVRSPFGWDDVCLLELVYPTLDESDQTSQKLWN